MSDLSVQQQQQLNIYLKKNPKVSRENAIKILFGGNGNKSVGKGVTVEHKVTQAKPQTIYLQSGRKVVYTMLKDGRMACKYYGADGTQIKPEYFKKVEGQISISPDGASYTVTKNGKKSKLIKAKNPSLGQLDQNIVKLNNQEKKLNKIKKEQGFIGKSWDWLKNKTGIGDGSDKAQSQINAERDMLKQMRQPNSKIDAKQFEKITGQKCTKANVEKFKRGEFSQVDKKINGYKEGQEMAVDVVADVVSGVVSYTVYTAAVAAAPFSGGTSILLGVAVAAGTGAVVKSGVKAADAYSGGRKYTFDNLKKDAGTGAVSGALAPVTAGFGGAVGKTVATKLGLQTVKTIGKEIAEDVVENSFKQTLKTSLMSPGAFKFVGEGVGKKTLAYGSEVLADGVINGGIDNGFRTAVNGGSFSDVVKASGEGALFAPLVGLGMKGTGLVLSRGIGKNFVVHGKNVIENKRMLLKQKMAQGNKISLGGDGISIPRGTLRAPRKGFGETVQDYVNIIQNNKNKISQMTNEYLAGVIDERGLIDKFVKLLIKEMDMPIPPQILIKDLGNLGGSFNPAEIAVKINVKNKTRVSELFSTVMHEMHHFLQHKEMLVTDLEKYSQQIADKNNTTAPVIEKWLLDTCGWRDVLTKYPQNINPESKYTKRGYALLEADKNYTMNNMNAYTTNLKEVETRDIQTRVGLEVERIIGGINEREYQNAKEVYSLLNKNFAEDQSLINAKITFDSGPATSLVNYVNRYINKGLKPNEIVAKMLDDFDASNVLQKSSKIKWYNPLTWF